MPLLQQAPGGDVVGQHQPSIRGTVAELRAGDSAGSGVSAGGALLRLGIFRGHVARQRCRLAEVVEEAGYVVVAGIEGDGMGAPIVIAPGTNAISPEFDCKRIV